MELNNANAEKVRALISLYNHTYDETKKYRDHVWKLLVWAIGLLVGVLAATRARPDIVTTCNGKWLGTIFIWCVAGFGIWDILFAYSQLVWNRNILRRCEGELQFYEKGAYGGEAILPENWKTDKYRFTHCLQHFLQWTILIIAVAAYTTYMLWSEQKNPDSKALLEQIHNEVKVVAEQERSIKEDISVIKSELATVKMALLENRRNDQGKSRK